MSTPNNNRIPRTFYTPNPSKSGAPGSDQKVGAYVGMMLDSGATATAGVWYQVSRESEADALFGRGSQLAEKLRAAFRNNSAAKYWACGVTLSGTKSAGEIALTGTATAGGVLAPYIAGMPVPVQVSAGDTAAEVATALAAAITADSRLPVTAVATLGDVALTAKWDGLSGDDIDISMNLRETEDSTPAGITVALTAMAGGAGSPDFSTAITNLGGTTRYTHFCSGEHVDSVMDDMEGEAADRWDSLRMLYGHVFAGYVGTHAEHTTYGELRNSPHSSVMGGGKSPAPPWIWAAIACAVDMKMAHDGQPRFGQVMDFEFEAAPKESDRFLPEERNLLAYSGISTYFVEAGEIKMERLITTSQTLNGVEDTSYLPRTRLGMLEANAIDLRATLSPYRGFMIVGDDDAELLNPDVPAVTPSTLKSVTLDWYEERIRIGYAEDYAGFKAGLSVKRHTTDPERVDWVFPTNLPNELVTMGITDYFRA